MIQPALPSIGLGADISPEVNEPQPMSLMMPYGSSITQSSLLPVTELSARSSARPLTNGISVTLRSAL